MPFDFGGLSRDDDTLIEENQYATATNVDADQEGAIGVRDGLAYSTYDGIRNALGPNLFSLIPADLPWRLNFLLGCDDGTLRVMRGVDLAFVEP